MLTFDPSIRPTAEVGWVRMGQIERFIISFPMKSHPFWWVPEMGVTPKSSHSLDNFSKPMVLGTPTFENSHFLVLFAAVRRCWWVHGWSSRQGAEAQKGGNQANPTVFSLVKSICLEIEDNILAPFNYQMLADVWHGYWIPFETLKPWILAGDIWPGLKIWFETLKRCHEYWGSLTLSQSQLCGMPRGRRSPLLCQKTSSQGMGSVWVLV